MTDHRHSDCRAGVNHNGSLKRALELVDAAAEAGADMVKFQTFKASELVSARNPKAAYQLRNTGTPTSQLEMLRGLELSVSDHAALIERCGERGIRFLSTPFDFAGSHALLAERLRFHDQARVRGTHDARCCCRRRGRGAS